MDDAVRWTSTLDANLGVLTRMIDGVDDEAALRPILDGASSLNWMVGHLVVSRDSMLRAAGASEIGGDDVRACYGYGTRAPDADVAHPLADLVGTLRQQGEALQVATDALTDAALDDPSGITQASRRGYLEFMVWHETYHLGQAVLYRRASGLDSPIG